MSDPQLFDATPFQVAPEPTAQMGHDAQRTARRRALLEQGIHPITKRPVIPELGTCAGCIHFRVKTGYAKHYFKCDLTLDRWGQGPDVRASYPACDAFEPAQRGDA
ncbi:MAG: hypothetical protein HOW59_02470 [Nonomuraea sp.]|nr:hypothetical protein [Nonomuraea sp.]NUR81064.1 hypothetical protein [Dermatophilaceae bacterium]